MSPLFGRRPATRPEYLTPPDPQAAIAEIDRRLLSIALIPAECRTDVQHGFAGPAARPAQRGSGRGAGRGARHSGESAVTQTDPERLEWLSDRTMRVLVAAMDRDGDQVADLLGEIGDAHGAQGMYGVCCALSETVRQFAFPSVRQGDGSLSGDMIAIQKLPGAKDEPDALFAARFVAAYINGDHDTTTSLFFGSIRDEEAHAGGVVALIGLAADIARQREAES